MISLISGAVFFLTALLIYLKYKYNFRWLEHFEIVILIDVISLLSLLIFGLSLNSDIFVFVLVMLLILIASQRHLVLDILLAVPTALLFTNQPMVHFSNTLTSIYSFGTFFYGLFIIGHDFNKYCKKLKGDKEYKNKIVVYWQTCQFIRLLVIFIKRHFSSYKHHIL